MQVSVSPQFENKIEHFFIRATTPSMHVSTEHTHKEWETIYVLEGCGFERINGFPHIPLQPGTILCLPPDIPHESVVEQPYRSITFRVSNYQFSQDKHPFFLTDNIQQDFRTLVTLMLRLYVENATRNGNMIRHLIYCMLDFIRQNAGVSPSNFTCVDKIKQQIHDNFQDPNFDLGAMIRSSGYSANYLRSRFTEAEGIPPHQYLLKKRLEYAMELLQNDGDSVRIAHVARACGFSDPQYFSRMFKKWQGFSPSDVTKRKCKTLEPCEENINEM